jgi:unsaturated rhamnogalacturonyl hydrolase
MSKKINLLVIFIFFTGCLSSQHNSEEGKSIAVELTDNFLLLYPDTVAYKTEAKSYKWNYEQGLILEAFYRIWKLSDDNKYYKYLKKNIDYYIDADGKIKTYKLEDFNLDNIALGRILLHLYSLTADEKYKKAADILMEQLKNQPRTGEGGFWHKQRYPYQMWLDGLYMAEPFYTEYAVMFNEQKYFDDVAKQFHLINKNLKDEVSSLYYHGWDESRKQKWSDPETGKSPSFWGRSIGWFMMAMVDVLDLFPSEHPARMEILKMFTDLSESLLKYRDAEKKLWHQIVDQGGRKGNYIETSSSLMFIYSLAKGANKGYLPEEYYQIAEESFKSLLNNFIITDENGFRYLQNTVSVGGLGGEPYRNGSYEYYLSEPIRVNDFKGYGPLILAAIELNKN